MASFYTNRGLGLIQKWALAYGSFPPPATFYLALVKATPAPDVDTKLMSDLAEIAAGNGYTAGGEAITPDSTGFPTFNEDDTLDLADLTERTVTWLASGGQIPPTGAGPSFAVLTTDEGTIANRQIIYVLDLEGEQIRAAGLPLTVGAVSRGEHP